MLLGLVIFHVRLYQKLLTPTYESKEKNEGQANTWSKIPYT
jgi:hypothetical protein